MIYIYNKNKEMLFDTLLCVTEPQEVGKIYDRKIQGDVTTILDDEKVVGYNIANISKKLSLTFEGVELMPESTLEENVKKIIEGAGADAVEGSLKQHFVVAYVETCIPHPDSDKLSVCQVDLGTEKVQIVCGASNIAAGQKVVVATVGCMMPTGLVIVPAVLRKEPSNGMICSARELGLPKEQHKPGIMVLDDAAPVGTLFFEYVKELN